MKSVKILQIVAISIMTAVCSCNSTLDTTDYKSIATYVVRQLGNQNFDQLGKVLKYEKDSIPDIVTQSMVSISESLSGKDFDILRIDTIWRDLGFDNDFYFKYIVASLHRDGSFYDLWMMFENDVNQNYLLTFMWLEDLVKSCAELNETPYCPTDKIDFRQVGWEYTPDAHSIIFMQVELQNNTNYHINYLKFRMRLSRRTGEVFLSQTVESFRPIPPGDIVMIVIPGINNFYAGFDLVREGFIPGGELIEVLPKPKEFLSSCNKIDDLILLLENGKKK